MNATTTAAETVIKLPPCPSWCSREHDGMTNRETIHERVFGATGALDLADPLTVSGVTFDELMPDGSVTRTTPGISINAGPDGFELTLEQAAELHRALGEALRLLGMNQGGSTRSRTGGSGKQRIDPSHRPCL